MEILFWICWLGEMAGATWWVITELRLTRIDPNPFAYLSLAYLLLVLAIRYGLEWTAVSNALVMVPAIPLGLYCLMILLFVASGKKWN